MKKLFIIFLLISFFDISIAAKKPHSDKKAAISKKSSIKKNTHLKRKAQKSTKKPKYKIATLRKKRHIQYIPKVKLASTLPKDSINHDAINNQPYLYSYSALAINTNTNEVLISKNPTVKLPIASITKLMTAMVFLDSDPDLEDTVIISSSDIDRLRHTYSRLAVGMELKKRDLLLLALMSSENRAAHALGRTAYPGGIKEFVRKMNEKARSIGMQNTHFYDPTGLTSANQATAEDLAKMVEHAFQYDMIRKYSTTKNASVVLGPRYVHRYMNSDALVRKDSFPISVSKTGFINEAGHCLVLYSLIAGQPIVMVFLNSSGKGGRLIDAISVKNYIKKIT